MTYEHDAERSGDTVNESVLTTADAATLSLIATASVPINYTVSGSQSSIVGSLAVADGVVYAGSWNGALYAFNASSLTELWSLQLTNPRIPGAATNSALFWRMGGIGATPTVLVSTAGGKTYMTVIAAAGTGIYVINATPAGSTTHPSVLWFTNLTNSSSVLAGAKNWGYANLWGTVPKGMAFYPMPVIGWRPGP